MRIQAHAGPDTIVCPGDSAIIGGNPIATNYSPPLSITWTPNTNISNNSVANPKVWPSTATWYYLNVSDFNGRSATDSVLVTPFSATPVTMDPIPTTCLRDQPFNLTQGSPSGGVYKGKGISGTSTFDPQIAGKGYHDIWYVYQNQTCNFLDSIEDSIFVSWGFEASLRILEGSTDTICRGDTGIMAVSNGAAQYRWNPDTNLTTNVKGDSAFLWPDTTSFYWLIYNDTAGCSDSSILQITVIECETGIQKSILKGLKVYPNPSKERLYIESYDSRLQARILDMSGRNLLQKELEKKSDFIDLSDLPTGTYILQLQNSEGISESMLFIRSD